MRPLRRLKTSPAVQDATRLVSRLRSRRALACAVVGVLVLTGLGLDRPAGDAGASSEKLESAISAGAPPGVLSSAWYCPMVYATRADPGAGAIVLTNFGSYPVSAVASIVPSVGPAVDVPVNVEGQNRTLFNPGVAVDAPYAAVTVRVDGGGLAVEHAVRDAFGSSAAPCTTETSNQWHVADGSTDGTEMRLGIYNPSDDYAIVDMVATTDIGRSAPVEYAGVLVPARGLMVVNVGEQLRRRQWVAASVNARRGRVVVNQMQSGVLRNAPGVSIAMASPKPAGDVRLPQAMVAAGVTDRITVYNPSREGTEATIEITPENGTPVERTVYAGPFNRSALDLETQPAVPRDQWTSVRVKSSTDVPLVAQRTNTAVAPSPVVGVSTAAAMVRPWERWIVASSNSADPGDAWVWTFNPTNDPVDVRITLLGDGRSNEVRVVRVEPRLSSGFHADDIPDSANRSVMIEADAPVFVSRQLRQIPGTQLSTSPAIPLR